MLLCHCLLYIGYREVPIGKSGQHIDDEGHEDAKVVIAFVEASLEKGDGHQPTSSDSRLQVFRRRHLRSLRHRTPRELTS